MYVSQKTKFKISSFQPQNIDTRTATKVSISQLESWHKHKTNPTNPDITILGNKKLLRYFLQKFNNITINENTDLLENSTPETKVPCLPLSMILIAFHISHFLHT